MLPQFQAHVNALLYKNPAVARLPPALVPLLRICFTWSPADCAIFQTNPIAKSVFLLQLKRLTLYILVYQMVFKYQAAIC